MHKGYVKYTRLNRAKWYLWCVGCVVELFIRSGGIFSNGVGIGMVNRLCVWG